MGAPKLPKAMLSSMLEALVAAVVIQTVNVVGQAVETVPLGAKTVELIHIGRAALGKTNQALPVCLAYQRGKQ